MHAHVVARGGRYVLADEIGTNGKLAVAAVHQHRETYGARTSVVDQGIHRGSNRPAGEEHVVDEHDDPFVDREWDFRLAHHRRVADSGQVVAVERDVDGAERDQGALVRPNRRLDAGRERVAARPDTDDGESGEVAIALYDLVRDPRDGPADVVRRKQRGRLALLPGLTGPVLKGEWRSTKYRRRADEKAFALELQMLARGRVRSPSRNLITWPADSAYLFG